MAAPSYRFLAYAISRNDKDLIRVVVNQTDAVKAARDAKRHSVTFGESWLYMITNEKQQLLVGHFVNGSAAPTTPPKMNKGYGKAFTFHGSFTSKLAAKRKEAITPGSFIQEKDGRYYLLKPKRVKSNPAGAVKIYGRCLRIEAIKTVSHSYGGKPTTGGQRYFHDFTTKNAMIYGLPDGSLLIKSK